MQVLPKPLKPPNSIDFSLLVDNHFNQTVNKVFTYPQPYYKILSAISIPIVREKPSANITNTAPIIIPIITIISFFSIVVLNVIC